MKFFDDTMTSITMKCGLVLPVLFYVAGCAIQPGKSTDAEAETATESKSQRIEYVEVDVSLQKDFDRAVGLIEQEQYADAIPVLDTVIAREQRLTAPYINLAIARAKLDGKDKKVKESLDKAIELEADNPQANNELGLWFRRHGKFDEARQAYSKSLESNEDYLPALKNLGILCDIYLRDWDCALQQFERYQELAPDDKQVEIWIADLRRRSGG